jgi:hypothetical protein
MDILDNSTGIPGFSFFLLGLLCLPLDVFLCVRPFHHHTQWQKPWYVFEIMRIGVVLLAGAMLDCYFFGFVFVFLQPSWKAELSAAPL